MEALIHRVGNYPDLLPEIPRYCCPLKDFLPKAFSSDTLQGKSSE